MRVGQKRQLSRAGSSRRTSPPMRRSPIGSPTGRYGMGSSSAASSSYPRLAGQAPPRRPLDDRSRQQEKADEYAPLLQDRGGRRASTQ